MRSSSSDGWSGEGWISLRDINDNIVFKNFMRGGVSQERYQFGLYSPIHKNDEWRLSDCYESGWNMNSFNHNQWSSINGGSSFSVSSTVYLIKSFVGMNGMASIDIELYYREGIIVYMNGIEIYRDNMNEGLITHFSLAIGSYNDYAYRGIIIPSAYGEVSESMICIELHLTNNVERIIDFNCFISYASGISEDNPCSVYPHDISASTDEFNSLSQAFDCSVDYYAWVSPSSLPANVIASFDKVIPLIHSIRFYTWYTDRYPSSFTVSGRDLETSWYTLLTLSGQTYSQYSWKQWSLNSPSLFKSINFTVHSTAYPSNRVQMDELQFMTCNEITPHTSFVTLSTTSIILMSLVAVTISLVVIRLINRRRKTLPKVHKHAKESTKLSSLFSQKLTTSKSIINAPDKAVEVVVGLSLNQTDFKSL